MRRIINWLNSITDAELVWVWRLTVLAALVATACSTTFLASLALVTLYRAWTL